MELIEAVMEGNTNLVEQLLKHPNTDVNHVCEEDGEITTALIAAVLGNRDKIAKLLLENRADPDLINQYHNSALIAASKNNSIEIVKTLLDFGANPNIRNERERTPLIVSVMYNNIGISKLLLEKGAKIDLQDRNGETALIRAVYYDRNKFVSLLLSSGANPNIRTSYAAYAPYCHSTALIYAVDCQSLTNIRTLLQYHPDLDIKDFYGRTALDKASQHEDKTIYNLLQNYKRSLNLGSLKNLCISSGKHHDLFDSLPFLLTKPNELDKQIQNSTNTINKRKFS